ncbi:MFS transporter [Allocoprobacillus halotolerans]|uniref:MFS transporter n=1 Tax=Allocoprobacillus halotolerans TaxID=2944914 RepID=A0ABY5I0Z1_9FIRM|nr:MFS transporter [Allocoprobacillus halotolerans]UTY38605.1 MFS transporter [Allocoprobacillus halotolerans]
MKSLQMKYNFLHILFWVSYLSIYGYIAIFLQYRGLSNTDIGIVSGGGAILSIFLSPFISSLLTKIPNLSIRKLILILYIIMFFMFISLYFITSPLVIIMLFYILLLSLVVSIVPFLSMICMDYLKDGQYINFGISRGLGSISYAIGAVVVSRLIEWLNPTVIIYTHLLSGFLLLVVLFSMPPYQIQEQNQQEHQSSAFTIIKNYRIFFMILVAFAFMLAASTTLSTYLINIVKNLGGSTSLYGIAVFCMAASEMPVMSITYRLLKKYRAETLILVSAGFYLIRNFTICLAPSLPILLIGMMFQGFSYGLFTATITYYVNDYLKESDQMMGQTLIGMMSTGLGSAVGNIFGGVLQDTFGLSSMLIFAGTMTLIGFLVMFLTLRKKVGLSKRPLIKSYEKS